MIEATDFLLGDDDDLLIVGGDFAVGLSEEQHVNDILIDAPGSWKQEPTIGVDLINELNAPNGGEDINRIRKTINVNLSLDGVSIVDMNFKTLEDFELNVERK